MSCAAAETCCLLYCTGGTFALLSQFFPEKMNINTTFVDVDDAAAVKGAIRPNTKVHIYGCKHFDRAGSACMRVPVMLYKRCQCSNLGCTTSANRHARALACIILSVMPSRSCTPRPCQIRPCASPTSLAWPRLRMRTASPSWWCACTTHTFVQCKFADVVVSFQS